MSTQSYTGISGISKTILEAALETFERRLAEVDEKVALVRRELAGHPGRRSAAIGRVRQLELVDTAEEPKKRGWSYQQRRAAAERMRAFWRRKRRAAA